MKNTLKTSKESNKRINPVLVGVAGAAVMAAGATAAVILSKKENRKKAGKALKTIKTKGKVIGTKLADTIDQAIKINAKVDKKINKTLKKAKKVTGVTSTNGMKKNYLQHPSN